MVILASGAEPWLMLNGVPLSFKHGDENLEAQAAEYKQNELRISPSAPDRLEITIDDEMLETERYGYWHWRPRGFAGLYRLRVKAPGHRARTALVRVLPSKISYRRYVQMLKDVSNISVDLLFALNSPAGEKANLMALREDPSAYREYALVKSIMADLAVVIADIRRNPLRSLSQKTEKRLLHEVHYFAGGVEPVPGPACLLPESIVGSLGMRQLPAEWTTTEGVLTYDVYENRLLKHFLWCQLLSRIIKIQDQATYEIKRRKQQLSIKRQRGWEDDETPKIEELTKIEEDCQSMSRQCIAWGSTVMLREVGGLTIGAQPTQVLQKHPDYSRFFRLYLHFQQELGISLNVDRYITELSLHRMSQLYETWSVFKLTQLILGLLLQIGYRVVTSSGFFEVLEEGFTFDVQRNAGIELVRDELQVRILYEPVYPSQSKARSGVVARWASQLTPDLAVEIWRNNEARQVLIFDAKYRSRREGRHRVYLEEDRSKMDYYANTIVWKPKGSRQRLRQVVSSAYILYPGDVVEHDPDFPKVGALPLVPQMDNPRKFGLVVIQLLRHAGLLEGK